MFAGGDVRVAERQDQQKDRGRRLRSAVISCRGSSSSSQTTNLISNTDIRIWFHSFHCALRRVPIVQTIVYYIDTTLASQRDSHHNWFAYVSLIISVVSGDCVYLLLHSPSVAIISIVSSLVFFAHYTRLSFILSFPTLLTHSYVAIVSFPFYSPPLRFLAEVSECKTLPTYRSDVR